MVLRLPGIDEFGHNQAHRCRCATRRRDQKRISKGRAPPCSAMCNAEVRPPPTTAQLATRFGVNAADAAHAGGVRDDAVARPDRAGAAGRRDASTWLVPQSWRSTMPRSSSADLLGRARTHAFERFAAQQLPHDGCRRWSRSSRSHVVRGTRPASADSRRDPVRDERAHRIALSGNVFGDVRQVEEVEGLSMVQSRPLLS